MWRGSAGQRHRCAEETRGLQAGLLHDALPHQGGDARLTVMWSITNYTPYKAGKTWTRTKEGVHQWIVVVKAVYDIDAHGAVSLSDEQPELLRLPEYHGAPGGSSLKYDADL